MEDNNNVAAIAALAAATIAAGSYAATAYDGKYNEDPDTASITDEVVERLEKGEKVEVNCDRDGDCRIID